MIIWLVAGLKNKDVGPTRAQCDRVLVHLTKLLLFRAPFGPTFIDLIDRFLCFDINIFYNFYNVFFFNGCYKFY